MPENDARAAIRLTYYTTPLIKALVKEKISDILFVAKDTDQPTETKILLFAFVADTPETLQHLQRLQELLSMTCDIKGADQ